MKLNLTGKTAVVTGAGRGIGLATVRTLMAKASGLWAPPARSRPS
jgi:NAD(P)-dependent dehydrogenase (short-subunit alcohol dehydrogenase family)